MILNLTPQERAQLEILVKEQDKLIDQSLKRLSDITEEYGQDAIQLLNSTRGNDLPAFKKEKVKFYAALAELEKRFLDLLEELERKRFAKLTTPAAILADGKQQIDTGILYLFSSLSSNAYHANRREKGLEEYPGEEDPYIEIRGMMDRNYWDRDIVIERWKEEQKEPDRVKILLKAPSVITYLNRFLINKHQHALKGKEEGAELDAYLIKAVLESEYTAGDIEDADTETVQIKELLDQSWLTMYHGKPTDQLAQISSRGAIYNPYNDSAKVNSGSVEVTFKGYKNLKGASGVNEHKLLSTAIAVFTNQNNYSRKERPARSYRVNIPEKKYAQLCGYNVGDKATVPKDIRNKFKSSLKTLDSISIKWTESKNGSGPRDFEVNRLIAGYGIRNGFITITFNPEFGNWLLTNPQTQYPIVLLGIDARNPNAYSIGVKISEHYNMDTNQNRGTANILQIKTLLEVTNLPPIDTIRKQRTSWERRIKEPFETALDVLTKIGFLKDWRYTKAKGEDLTEEEATNITDYSTFEDLYIVFELENAPDHTERLIRRAEEKEQAQEKKRKRASSKEKQ